MNGGMKSRRFILVLGLIASLSFSGCGGGGSATTAATYTVGVTVSGFSGADFVLQNNGGDDLLINGNGSFTFDKPVVGGGSYRVTVLKQPPSQHCPITNGSGTIGANVTDVQVACVSNLQALYAFGNAPDGIYPAGNLVFDGSGNLYGATSQGGIYGAGIAYKLTPENGQWTETVLYSFCQQTGCQDGSSPSSLVVDGAGNLYGTSYSGGAYGRGIVFELTPTQNGTWTETILHSFGNGADGYGPAGGLVFDKAGNLYGTSSGGSGTASPNCPTGCGTVFELFPGSNGQWTENILYNFCSQGDCVDGSGPRGGLLLDAKGNLFGTTFSGGVPDNHNDGTVFELSPSGNGQWTHTVLYMFQSSLYDASMPNGNLIQDKSGNLYGTAPSGGSTNGNSGVVFKLTQGTQGQWTESILYQFCSVAGCLDGGIPYAGLTIDQAGNLNGTTTYGGVDWGVVFELTPGASTASVLYTFPGGVGGSGPGPGSGVILDSEGNLYGVAGGGTYGNGIVFEVIR